MLLLNMAVIINSKRYQTLHPALGLHKSLRTLQLYLVGFPKKEQQVIINSKKYRTFYFASRTS